MKPIVLWILFHFGRAVARLLRGKKVRKPETGENTNGALPAFAFSGCATRERPAPEPSTAAYSNEATIGDLIDILEHGVERPKAKKRGKRRASITRPGLISTK